MLTKEQERIALNKIVAILEDLDEVDGHDNNSYVLTAFEGCTQLALENIENDCMISFPDTVEHERNRADNFQKRAKDLQEENERLTEHNAGLEEEVTMLTEMIDQRNERIKLMEADCERVSDLEEQLEEQKELNGITAEMFENAVKEKKNLFDENCQLTDDLHDAQLEIITLKAKLYDLMTAK